MALISQIPVVDVAAVTARALEELLGHDIALHDRDGRARRSVDDVVARRRDAHIVLPFRDGIVGEVTLVVDERLATAMEAATPDGSLTTAALPALLAGADAIAFTTNLAIDPEDACEIATGTLLDGCRRRCRRGAAARQRDAGRVPGRPHRRRRAEQFGVAGRRPARPRGAGERCAQGRGGERGGVAARQRRAHEFQPLRGTRPPDTPARPLSLLNDVAMDITASWVAGG